MTIHIVLADDHRMFREAIRASLLAEGDFAILAEAGSGRETFAVLQQEMTDILVLDIALPDMSGIEVAQQVSRQYPQIGIVALSGYSDKLFIQEMFKAGAKGYVLKSAATTELLQSIRAVHLGNRFLCTELTGIMLGRFAEQNADGCPPVSVLSPRERQILGLLACGKRAAEIAPALGISIATVEVHRRNIKGKLGVRTTAELTRYAIREGVITA